ncbi:MAG: hypothetical protein LBV78_26480 [Kitasatospora sp.]|nr:hypothetical protein [Kitasatospora sp.]
MTAAGRPEPREQTPPSAASPTATGIPPGDQDDWLDRDTDARPNWPRCPTRSWKTCSSPRRPGRRHQRGR